MVSTDGYQRKLVIFSVYVLPVGGGSISIQLDDSTGVIILFSDSRSTSSFASEDHPLGQVVYQTFTDNSFDTFLSEYLYTHTSWAYRDFGKYRMNVSTLQVVSPTIKELWRKFDKIKMEYSFP